jgi:hypothetical protein
MIIVQDQDNETVAKIGINTPCLKLPLEEMIRDRMYLIISRDDNPYEYNYFLAHYNELWKNANPVY